MVLKEQEQTKNWIESYDISSPSEEFTNNINHIHDKFNSISTKKISNNIKNTPSVSSAPDIIDIHTGYCEYIKQQKESQQTDIVFDIEMANNPSPSEHKISSELSIVLDVSGSMAGGPLEQSKQAIVKVIDSLCDNDYLHFVTYSSTSELKFKGYMNESNKKDAKLTVMTTRSTGSTNMVAGIITAFDSMYDNTDNTKKDDITSRRIFLFTDGEVNCGVKDRFEIGGVVSVLQQNFGINCTTFGFGSSFDEELMRHVAEMGKGDYFYIDGIEDIDFKVSKGLEVLQSLFAINAKLILLTNNSKGLKVNINNIHGYNTTCGISANISLGDLCFDDLRQILCSISIEGSDNITDNADINILDYTLCYSVLESNGGYTDRKKSGNITIKTTTDENLPSKIPDSLFVAKTLQNVNIRDKKVLELVKNNDFESAISLKKQNINDLENILTIDKTGVVIHLISRAKSILTKLENDQEEADSIEKDIGYESYQCGVVHRKCF